MIRLSILALLLSSAALPAFAQDPHSGHAAPAAQAQPDPHAAHRTQQPPAAGDPHAGHAAPATDPHAGHAMPAAPAHSDPHAGHTMPTQAPDPQAGHAMPAPAQADPHAGHAMAAPAQADPHPGHTMAGGGQTGADLPVGSASAPAPITDALADGVYGSEAMARARDVLAVEHGRAKIAKLQVDLLEWAPDDKAYNWEVEGWWGGDINRLAFKSEGEGREGDGLESAEVQLLYSRAVSRYTDVQFGLRYDIEPRSRAYLALGADAMFPYWFEAEGSLFLSEDGDVLGRLEGSYDLRLTQKLILQPRAELEFAAQDIAETATGSGLSSGELGLRLRYEVRRDFAPYVGVSYERAFGRTADFARAAGEHVDDTRVVIGLRTWF